jgi:hypothetical protein
MAFASGPYNHFPGMMSNGDSDTLPVPDSVLSDYSDMLKHHNLSLKGGRYISKEELDSLLKDSVPEHSFIILPDTAKKDTVPVDTSANSNVLDSPVKYEAKDSIVFDYRSSRAHLYGNSKVNYQNLELDAEEIDISIDSSLVYAAGRKDSTGVVQGKPLFKQGTDEYEPDKIAYNFKTRKAFVTNVYTQEGEGFMQTIDGKRDSSGVMYIRHGKYTTCDAEHPHFYLALSRAKMHPGKNVIFGPAHIVVEDVPLPLALPYGFFPFKDKYSSGFIMPTYGDETSRGFYLRDGGYYFAINDYVDVKLLGDIYTKGSWSLSAQSTYKRRYKYNGNLLVSYQYTHEGEKNFPDESISKSFKITWSHRQDAKANPTQSFSASVNFATSSYERNNLTSMYNPESYTQSTRTSSLSYSKSFPRVGLTLSGSFNLSQNVRDSSISVTLPNLTISLNRFYPFKRRKMAGKEHWYEKIAMSYTGNITNSINTKENLLFKSSLLKDWRNGMRHQIPISASFSIFKYINVTPSFNFTDRMYSHKVMQSWDIDNQRVRRDTIYGFYNVYNFNMSVSANTKIYGMFYPMPWAGGKKINAIRHVFTPTISFSYAPDFSNPSFGFYDSYVKTDANGNVSTVSYSPFSGGAYGTVGTGMTGNVSVDISNNVEMKINSKRDSTGLKKVSLIDEFGLNMSYNMAAKVRPLSDLNMRLRLKLTKSYTFSMNAVFATYAYEFDQNGNVRVGEKTEYSQGRFGRFQGMSQNLSYTFNNNTFKKLAGLFGKSHRSVSLDQDGQDNEDDEYEEDDDEMEMQNVDPERKRGRMGGKGDKRSSELDEDGYLKFSMPWNLSVSYGITMRENTSAPINPERMRYPYKFTQTLNFSGNLQISEGWNINFSSGYDFNYKKLSMTTASLSRDLHCFSMSASMVVFPYTSYNFTFACKAGTLADALRWKKQSSYSGNIQWYQ